MKLKRRPVVLLEVLIAFALVALCALPLIYPHVFILRSEKKFISTVELDHLVNHLYANLFQKLYQNEIPWQDIENEKKIPVDAALLSSAGYDKELPFTGSYQFTKIRQKPPKGGEITAYLFNLEFTFVPKHRFFLEKQPKEGDEESKIIYNYQVALERVQK